MDRDRERQVFLVDEYLDEVLGYLFVIGPVERIRQIPSALLEYRDQPAYAVVLRHAAAEFDYRETVVLALHPVLDVLHVGQHAIFFVPDINGPPLLMKTE